MGHIKPKWYASLSHPPTILTGERLDGGVDSLSVSGYKPQNGSGYRIPVGVLTTIIIDPVDKVFWVEEPEVTKP